MSEINNESNSYNNITNNSDLTRIKIGSLDAITNNYDYANSFIQNPTILIIFSVIIIFYYSLFSTLGINKESYSENNSSFFEIIIWVFFIVLIIINGIQYFYNINIITSISDILTDKPKVELDIEMPKENELVIKEKKEVFHVPNNLYTFEDAKAICKAYNSELADYDQIKETYENGGEWCGFGWSKNQMAFYPTQDKTYKKLQKIKGHEHDCGRPGINGGHIANPNVKFGVNCYGYKPKINKLDAHLMKTTPFYPKSQEDIEFDKKVNYWKTQIPNMIISPFNKDTWNKV